MTHTTEVTGEVLYREGDGMPLPVPQGSVEVELTELDATLSWEEGPTRGAAAMPRSEFERFVDAGTIQPLPPHPGEGVHDSSIVR
ncbi:hypothetical protein [Aquincola tertiaricarbonis]|uniref:hypothetical protein n=1 Tax=Aquincola tertiaricarbonis TaxID=391953 RepID=UPI0009F8E7AF|nr:hypothetical protein [Aquincola tertiaricarbonis]